MVLFEEAFLIFKEFDKSGDYEAEMYVTCEDTSHFNVSFDSLTNKVVSVSIALNPIQIQSDSDNYLIPRDEIFWCTFYHEMGHYHQVMNGTYFSKIREVEDDPKVLLWLEEDAWTFYPKANKRFVAYALRGYRQLAGYYI